MVLVTLLDLSATVTAGCLKVASFDVAEAQSKLVRIYANGYGERHNFSKAQPGSRKPPIRAVGRTSAYAELYAYGASVAKDDTRAATWFERAASQDGRSAGETSRNCATGNSFYSNETES